MNQPITVIANPQLTVTFFTIVSEGEDPRAAKRSESIETLVEIIQKEGK